MRGFTKTALACAALALACSDSTGPTDKLQRDLAQAEARWAEAGPDAYSYMFSRVCFCGPDFTRPVVLEISGGVVTRAVDAGTGAPAPFALEEYPTVEALFHELREAVESEPAVLDAEFDDQLGYPTRGWVDRSLQIADEESGFNASELRPLDL